MKFNNTQKQYSCENYIDKEKEGWWSRWKHLTDCVVLEPRLQ